MNRYNFKNRLVLLLFGFSLFYIQAADKDAIENQPSVNNKQEAGNKNEHIADPSHQPYTQPADGLRFTTKTTQRASQKNNTHVTAGAVSTKKTTYNDVDETLIEEIINKYTNGFPLNAYETKILKDNINELRKNLIKTIKKDRKSVV